VFTRPSSSSGKEFIRELFLWWISIECISRLGTKKVWAIFTTVISVNDSEINAMHQMVCLVARAFSTENQSNCLKFWKGFRKVIVGFSVIG